jgi:hypothetical protein
MAAVLACPSPNRFFENKIERARGEEREKIKEGGGEREEKGRSGTSKQPPIMARV